MRLAFFGTPQIAARYLEALAERHEIVGVVTQPDRPKGRRGARQPSPVKEVALRLGSEVLQPETGRCSEACSLLCRHRPEACVVVAFGQKLPCGAGDCASADCINVHYSLLPKLRGAAPVQHAILQGLDQTGVTIQHVSAGWDEGDIILQRPLDIRPDDTCPGLTDRLTAIGIPALGEALDLLAAGTAPRTQQEHHEATLAPAIKREDGAVDWSEAAELIARKVRAFDPWPRMTATARGKPLKILSARAEANLGEQEGECGQVVELATRDGFAVSCGEGRLWVEEVQLAGKKPMSAADYLRGARLEVGERLE